MMASQRPSKRIPIIDLFAGPGGLGEGFSSVVDNNNNRQFDIALSIERDDFAHKTLTLRSFLRQFPFKKFPKEYYDFVAGRISSIEDLYSIYPEQSAKARFEAWKFSLGNARDHSLIDKRIKEVLEGEDFVLIGGPPCQAYSLVGRARRKEKDGLKKEDERVYLYREYYRILAVHRPAVFIMENVKGILSSRVENDHLFKQILNDLQDPIEAYKKLKGEEPIYKSRIHYNIYSLVMKSPGNDIFGSPLLYEPKDFVIRAENFGIPQTRHRVILLGIRSDIDITPGLLDPGRSLIPVERVLNGLPTIRSGLSKSPDGKREWKEALQKINNTNFRQKIEGEVWEKMASIVNTLVVPRKGKGSNYVESDISIDYNPDWFLDDKLKGACNHESRTHIIGDLHRYLFAACFSEVKGRSPKLVDFPRFLLPKHFNIDQNKFADRFRTQLYGQPSKTITSHISKDGHYFIHPDPKQCRSLTVREAARIQTFPDNYFFCGARTQQFHQVGNAVPPYLAFQIGKIVSNIIRP